MKLLEKILRKLFPKTLNKIVNDGIHNSEIINQYGSFENYNKVMQFFAEDYVDVTKNVDIELEYAESEEHSRYDQYLIEKYDLNKSIPKNKTN